MVGLDLGQSKCCFACGTLDPQGSLRLIAIAEHLFTSEEKNRRFQTEMLRQTLNVLILRLEREHGLLVKNVSLAISGTHLEGHAFAKGEEGSILLLTKPFIGSDSEAVNSSGGSSLPGILSMPTERKCSSKSNSWKAWGFG